MICRPRKMSIAEQRRRARELDDIRLQRPLTPTEQAEDDRLTEALYQRVWRTVQSEREAAMRENAL